MTKKEIEYKIQEVKSDYIRIQSDLEKLDSVGGNSKNAEKQLQQLEIELADLNKQLANLK
ncbi:SE1832 family protein [Aquibacillus rhizosphaerae]|uniref:SE1832 family protein n=1 Tax=Aquibacillus rhizosphaerae TaxID=3051431 RepID=A0ABT7L854_9BACI|nr:SE1832 family protein [Aquibacillus sp. LR5S19]MDL4842051.1 SE1832 family protein [Aquibacillus sp. LR5S19]